MNKNVIVLPIVFEGAVKAVMELASLLEEGEITPELEERLLISKEELEEKAINYGKVIKSINADVKTIDNELARLSALKESKVKTIDRLKESLANAMKLFHVDKIETPLMKISFRKSEVLEIENESLINPSFINKKEVVTIDRSAIKKAIKNGRFKKKIFLESVEE